MGAFPTALRAVGRRKCELCVSSAPASRAEDGAELLALDVDEVWNVQGVRTSEREHAEAVRALPPKPGD